MQRMTFELEPQANGAGFPVLLIAPPGGDGDARTAIALAGGRLQQASGWDTVAAQIDRLAARPVIVAEAEGVADAVLVVELPRLAAAAAALDLRVVVSFSVAQIDLVAAAMDAPGAELLCEPALAERVAMLALCGERATARGLGDRVMEDEAARLHRLNEEVARIAEVLARLTHRGHSAAPRPTERIADRRGGFTAQPADRVAIDPAEIRRVIRARRLRDRIHGAGLFEDPGWDMMLDLFAAMLERAQVSVSSLCIAAAVPPTTALRWIGKMTEAGLFARVADPFDRRRAFMTLTPAAGDGMRRYVGELRRANLPIV